ncbi:MAG: DUF58 domain-containing protein [Alphaproteobacteria bacterium]
MIELLRHTVPHTALRVSAAAAQLTAALPALLLDAERVAAVVQHGAHGRRRVGQGEAFWQYRRYQPGDDTSTIDWRSSARSQHYFVREREWEAIQTLLLWVDRTGSMDWHSSKKLPTKMIRALIIALAMARLALDAGEQVALLDEPTRRYRGKQALQQLALALLHLPPRPYPQTAALPRHASLLVVSDFLSPLETWDKLCSGWVARDCRGQFLQILDPAELDPPWQGRLLLESNESAPTLLAPRFENWHDAYREKLAARQDALRVIARAGGWNVTQHSTDAPPQLCINRLYQLFVAQIDGRKGGRP